jgi:hypothetical protein
MKSSSMGRITSVSIARTSHSLWWLACVAARRRMRGARLNLSNPTLEETLATDATRHIVLDSDGTLVGTG